MRGETHIKIGAAAVSAVFNMAAAGTVTLPIPLHPAAFAAMAVGSVIGSLLPDNDAKGTTISHFLPISNRIITTLAKKDVRACYHRHLLHSLLFLPVLIACAFIVSMNAANLDMELLSASLAGAWFGTVMHILADALLSRTWVLYPLIKKPVTLLDFSQAEHPEAARKVDRACAILAQSVLLANIGYYIHSYFY